MGVLGRLLVLVLAVSVVAARRGRRELGDTGGQSQPDLHQPAQNTIDTLEKLQEYGCVPEGFTAPDLSSCKDQRLNGGLFGQLECMANSLNVVGNSRYDQDTAEAFVDSLSSDEQWSGAQKDLLSFCAKMMNSSKPDDQQGVYMLACWHKLMMYECNKERMANISEAVSPLDGKRVSEAIAALTEGRCIAEGLKDPVVDEVVTKCAIESGVDFDFIGMASYFYELFATGTDIPAGSADLNTATDEQLVKFNITALCIMQAMGEIHDDGTINYQRISDNIDRACAPEWFKNIAKAVSDHCEDQNPQAADEYIACSIMFQPYGCASAMAYRLATSDGRVVGEEKEGVSCGVVGPRN